jgi:hypothetical protein
MGGMGGMGEGNAPILSDEQMEQGMQGQGMPDGHPPIGGDDSGTPADGQGTTPEAGDTATE